jgi:coniferyl-aldehyde dehydrogenase
MAALEGYMTVHASADALGLTSILARQRAAFLQNGAPPAAQRQADLAKLKTAILARRKEFEKAVSADFGHRSAYETAIMDIVPIVQGIAYLRRNLRKWMRPQTRRVAVHFMPGRAWVARQPLGVVGIISPWNYPLALSLMPLATAIAAGNRAMVKPSEFTPATTELLAAMLGDIFPEEQIAVIKGDASIAAAFAALPFDHLLFTGSTNVGRQVMRAASENLVPVTLELGGKSPVIVEPGFSPQRAAASIAFGKLANAGQTCIAPDYALVQADDVEHFLAAYADAIRTYYPDGASDEAYASIINKHHYDRLTALIDDARKKGARIIEIDHGGDLSKRERSLAPSVILNATSDMTVLQDEIFGPVLPVIPYKDMDEAIAYVNARPRPLALYVFAENRNVVGQVLARTTSGNVSVNDTLLHYALDDLPFGGVGPSGMGAYHGEEGFKTLSHSKGIFEQAKWNFTGLLRAPFGRLADIVLAYMLR